MNATPHIVESALMLLAAFAIGCAIGFVLKRLFGRKKPIPAPSSDQS